MIRRTVSLPPNLAEAADSAVAGGAARNFSQFVATALRRELDRQADDALAVEATKLDAAEETALARAARDARRAEAGTAPWGRVR